ncbi:Rne/Rng family ribonuclease [Bacillus massiliglaciei]|uniref:Rne/Rng family ribonuclease n=1 Tax=Bacillus massiliglaciei TaxID=1816693 RepID=UPI000DA603B2|nr:Rne/Rng family ribonuclease [Bacillus massiliglaciei]
MKRIIASLSSREKRYAVMERNQLVKLEMMPPGQESEVGNIYLGKVSRVLPGMDAAFIDYGAEKHGFLHRDELPSFQLDKSPDKKNRPIGQYLHQGEKLMVQVKRDETGTKGAKLSGLIELTSESLVYLYGTGYVGVSKKFNSPRMQKKWRETAFLHKKEGEGFIIRTSMENRTETEFGEMLESLRNRMKELERKAAAMKKVPGLLYKRDSFLESLTEEIMRGDEGELAVDDFAAFQYLSKAAENSGWRITHESGPKDIFSVYQLDAAVETAMKRDVQLEKGAYLIIEETEAFTVIDVNSGKFTGKMEKEATIYQTNLLAAKEAARQIRLRNIGGIILIDFINMEDPKHRSQIAETIKEAVSPDEMPVQVLGFTELGILQLTRKKGKPSLRETLTSPCPVCGGEGAVESPEASAFRLERELLERRLTDEEAVWVETNQDVARALLGENERHRDALEKMIAKKLFLTLTDHQGNGYRIKRFGSKEEISGSIQRH